MAHVGRGAAIALGLVVVAGCGSFQPFATPFVPRPALPVGEPWPGDVEAVVERFEAMGYACAYAPDSDIPGGWGCTNADGSSVHIDSDETGPISRAFAFLRVEEPPPEPQVMDARATSWFNDEVLAALVPEEVVPSDEEMLAMVQKNFPAEIGDGWILGFDRASNHRTLHVVYVEPDD